MLDGPRKQQTLDIPEIENKNGGERQSCMHLQDPRNLKKCDNKLMGPSPAVPLCLCFGHRFDSGERTGSAWTTDSLPNLAEPSAKTVVSGERTHLGG